MLAFSGIFPKRGKGPEKGQGTGPLVTRAGEGKVPVKVLGSKAAGPGSSLPYSQRTHKEQGTYLERETPRTPDDVAAAEATKELAKEQARAKRQQAKRAREEAAQAEASKKQREDVPEAATPAPIQEITDEEESSPSAQLRRRDQRSKTGEDIQLPSPTPETEEVVHRPGKEVVDPATANTSTLESSVPVPEQTNAPPPDEVLPAIPDFPEEDSFLGMNEDNFVETNEPLRREQQLNGIHDPEVAAAVSQAWEKEGVDGFVKKSIEVNISFSFFTCLFFTCFSSRLIFFLLFPLCSTGIGSVNRPMFTLSPGTW